MILWVAAPHLKLSPYQFIDVHQVCKERKACKARGHLRHVENVIKQAHANLCERYSASF